MVPRLVSIVIRYIFCSSICIAGGLSHCFLAIWFLLDNGLITYFLVGATGRSPLLCYPLFLNYDTAVRQRARPATHPVEKAACKLKPPVSASMSIRSPA